MILEIATIMGIAIGAVVLLYTMDRFKDWIRVKIGAYRNKTILTGLGRERLENGDFKVVQFFFDEDVQKFVETEAIRAQFIEEPLDQKFVDDVYIETPLSR